MEKLHPRGGKVEVLGMIKCTEISRQDEALVRGEHSRIRSEWCLRTEGVPRGPHYGACASA